jgi:Ca2+/H+ antiporter
MKALIRHVAILDSLLLLIPVAILLEYVFHAGPIYIFLVSGIAIIPLASLMGRATEQLADRLGEGLGGLLNATFGNAAELIIGGFALRAGLLNLVKASITGSIIGNVLLVFGLSVLAGGAKRSSGWPTPVSVSVLMAATAGIAWMSEFLVGAAGEAASVLGMNDIFVGVILIAIIGNAAEHSTAVMMAMKDRMDIAINIALGSSIQIALFVAPLLVFLSHYIAPSPMDLLFTPLEVISVVLAVSLIAFITQDGESNWMEGVQLLALYIILAIAFFNLPQ